MGGAESTLSLVKRDVLIQHVECETAGIGINQRLYPQRVQGRNLGLTRPVAMAQACRLMRYAPQSTVDLGFYTIINQYSLRYLGWNLLPGASDMVVFVEIDQRGLEVGHLSLIQTGIGADDDTVAWRGLVCGRSIDGDDA